MRENTIEAIVNRIADAVRAAIPEDAPKELSARLRPAVTAALEHAQLVPREEFERQLVLLERLEQQARRLEQRIAALERGTPVGDDRR
jgi:BMFP domain-containing protein YqiC